MISVADTGTFRLPDLQTKLVVLYCLYDIDNIFSFSILFHLKN